MSSGIEPSIRSRPVYGKLAPATAGAHLLMADAEGAQAILELAQSCDADWPASTEILYIPGAEPSHAMASSSAAASGAEHVEALRALGSPKLYIGPSIDAALPRLARSIERMRMGTQLYLAGSESLIGRAMQVAIQAGLDYQGIQTEHRGSLARRVQCVHCKGITENVTTQPVDCAHCGLRLLVRDHYSRRIAAFQGVNINAEDPSEVVPLEEAFR